MELSIYNTEGKDTGKKIKLSDDIFAIEPNNHAIYLDVKQYLANQRQGTHKSKERAEIARSTKKLKRQKGTGGARAGSAKSPVFVGGGRIFGPKPRDYGFKLNKKLKRLARKSALSAKASGGNITVLDAIEMTAPKTKDFSLIMKNLGLLDKKTLWVLGDSNKNVYLSSRNLRGTNVVNATDINTYDVVNAEKVIIVKDSIEKIETVLR
jgi:large subunit ribosomal protein L4